jgi:hypothetical protein
MSDRITRSGRPSTSSPTVAAHTRTHTFTLSGLLRNRPLSAVNAQAACCVCAAPRAGAHFTLANTDGVNGPDDGHKWLQVCFVCVCARARAPVDDESRQQCATRGAWQAVSVCVCVSACLWVTTAMRDSGRFAGAPLLLRGHYGPFLRSGRWTRPVVPDHVNRGVQQQHGLSVTASCLSCWVDIVPPLPGGGWSYGQLNKHLILWRRERMER